MITQEAASVWRTETSSAMTDDAFRHADHPDALVTLFSDDVWRFVASQVGRREDAEDIVMEVFAAAFSDFAKVRRANDQRLWLLAIARRKVSDCLRRQYRRAEQPFSSVEETAQAAWLDEGQIATRGALAKLPDPQGQALVLKYVNGLTTEEVSVVIRRSFAATNSLLQRARQSLRESLGPQIIGNTGETK
ncbi:MAG: RNA polymerase sigma factor [Fimbriimonas sp.]